MQHRRCSSPVDRFQSLHSIKRRLTEFLNNGYNSIENFRCIHFDNDLMYRDTIAAYYSEVAGEREEPEQTSYVMKAIDDPNVYDFRKTCRYCLALQKKCLHAKDSARIMCFRHGVMINWRREFEYINKNLLLQRYLTEQYELIQILSMFPLDE